MAMMFKNNPNHNPNAPSASALIQGTAGSFSTSFKEQELFDDFSVEVQEIEEEFWRTVLDRDAHVQVSYASFYFSFTCNSRLGHFDVISLSCSNR